MTSAWVIGGGGLLGSALVRALRRSGADLFASVERFRWDSEASLTTQLATAVKAFAASSSTATRWEIYWAAGVGNLRSSGAELAPETRALSILLRLLASEKRLLEIPGAIAFASSAGAIYAGTSDDIAGENTHAASTSAYGYEKLRQEALVRSFADANVHVRALLARLSTLYGPGQSTGKQQGLLAHIARCMLRNRPVQIHVPLDTVRDYFYSDDAAISIVAALRTLPREVHAVTRIVASEQPATIAEIVATFRKIGRRAPKVVTSASGLRAIYPRRVQFRSIVAVGSARPPRTSLLVGIAQLYAAELAAFAQCAESVNGRSESEPRYG